MGEMLFKYMNERFRAADALSEASSHTPTKEPGPVVTVSREAGCSGNHFVQELTGYLNKHPGIREPQIQWQYVNKEIIYETADFLKVDPNRVYKLFRGDPRKLMDEIVESLSTRYYKTDRMVAKAIRKIVSGMAIKGQLIILGRGGVVLTRDIKKSLHIKLMAPRDYRIEVTRKKFKVETKEAEKIVDETDNKREHIISSFGNRICTDCLFDVIFNCSTNSREEIFKSIRQIMEERKML